MSAPLRRIALQFQQSQIVRLLEFVRDQASTANQRAVNARSTEQRGRVIGYYAASVLDGNCIRSCLSENLPEPRPEHGMRFLGLLGSGVVLGIADRPDRLERRC
jgi:hypothetical protein